MSKYVNLKDVQDIRLKKGFTTKVFKTIIKGAERTEREIAKLSPSGDNHRAHKYSETWKVYGNKQTLSAIVYNKDNYRLTHLLENGHLNINSKNKLIWVPPQPHISVGFDNTKGKFEKDMEDIDVDIDIIT